MQLFVKTVYEGIAFLCFIWC